MRNCPSIENLPTFPLSDLNNAIWITTNQQFITANYIFIK